jgi:hypothetical protein
VIVVVAVATRLLHSSVLWADDNLPLAAAMQIVRGKILYRDIWFDKPPLVAWINLMWGAHAGVPLRLAGAIYVLAVAVAAWGIARSRWSEREGIFAAIFATFFLTFGLPSAVIPLASDMLLILPHLLAIYFAWRGKPFWSGAAAGIGLLCSSKAIFVLAACALWQWRSLPLLLAGFAAPNVIAIGWMWLHGSLADFYQQAWKWGSIYAANTFVENPWSEGLKRTANWIGFQAALVAGAIFAIRRDRDWRYLAWIALAFVGVVLGLRFFPRYYFLLLPPMIVLAARGWAVLRKPALLAILFIVPLLRFGPGYVLPSSRDLEMDYFSRYTAEKIRELGSPNDTLFVWGFRPDIFIYTQLPAATRFLESQPISGVLADRHLFSPKPVAADFLEQNRAELIRSRPTWIVDGLGIYNPALAISKQPYLAKWLTQYEEVDRSGFSILYHLR